MVLLWLCSAWQSSSVEDVLCVAWIRGTLKHNERNYPRVMWAEIQTWWPACLTVTHSAVTLCWTPGELQYRYISELWDYGWAKVNGDTMSFPLHFSLFYWIICETHIYPKAFKSASLGHRYSFESPHVTRKFSSLPVSYYANKANYKQHIVQPEQMETVNLN